MAKETFAQQIKTSYNKIMGNKALTIEVINSSSDESYDYTPRVIQSPKLTFHKQAEIEPTNSESQLLFELKCFIAKLNITKLTNGEISYIDSENSPNIDSPMIGESNFHSMNHGVNFASGAEYLMVI